jgi:hypothetical protein
MSIAQQTPGFSRTAQRGVIECEKCHTPIHVNRPGSVSVEFSVPCLHCGHRGIYFKRMLATDDSPERRLKPRD